MSKQLGLIIGIVAVVLIIVAGVFLLSKKPSSSISQEAVNQQLTSSGESTATRGSIKSLLGIGKNETCIVSYPSAEGETKGTVYVSGKKMRGDFTVKDTSGKEIESHMIADEAYNYFWSSAVAQGTKMKIDETVQATPTPNAQTQGTDLDREVDYKCSSWPVDDSKFVPPANIQFMDISQVIKQTQTQPSIMNTQKSACEQISDPGAKAACLEATSGY